MWALTEHAVDRQIELKADASQIVWKHRQIVTIDLDYRVPLSRKLWTHDFVDG